MGKGAFATVKLCKEKEILRFRVLKIYEKYKLYSKAKRINVVNEIRNLKKLSHKNIIKFITAINTKKQIVIVMEYKSPQSLFQYMQNLHCSLLNIDKVINIFKQIVSGIAYMHSRKIAHRDIKLENILIDSNSQIKIIDLGFSVDFSKNISEMKKFCGTPNYMSPEIVTQRAKLYDPCLVDVWALGVLFYKLLFGKYPFQGK